MSKKTREIYELFNEASGHLSKLPSKIDDSRLDQLLTNLYSPGPSFQYIFDYSIRQFVYTSKNVENVLGFNVCEFNPDVFMERFHPGDVELFLHYEDIARYFLFEHIKKEELPNYKVSYQIRIKDATGNYKLFLHQAIASSWDDDFKMSSSLANHSDISHITTVNNNKVSFIDITGKQSYFGISSIADLDGYLLPKNIMNTKVVSGRELEILSLIAEGLASNEIADYLNISVETVATHRKNILRKTNFKTFAQAVTYFVREGLI